MPPARDQDKSIGDLATTLLDNGKAYARAEVALVKQTVLARVAAMRTSAILLVAALILLQAALTGLVIAFGMLLAPWLGVPGGLGASALLTLVLIGVLAWIAVGKLKGAK